MLILYSPQASPIDVLYWKCSRKHIMMECSNLGDIRSSTPLGEFNLLVVTRDPGYVNSDGIAMSGLITTEITNAESHHIGEIERTDYYVSKEMSTH